MKPAQQIISNTLFSGISPSSVMKCATVISLICYIGAIKPFPFEVPGNFCWLVKSHPCSPRYIHIMMTAWSAATLTSSADSLFSQLLSSSFNLITCFYICFYGSDSRCHGVFQQVLLDIQHQSFICKGVCAYICQCSDKVARVCVCLSATVCTCISRKCMCSYTRRRITNPGTTIFTLRKSFRVMYQ